MNTGTEKTCGNCRLFEKVTPFEGKLVGYCVAYGTDSNTTDCKACWRWMGRE